MTRKQSLNAFLTSIALLSQAVPTLHSAPVQFTVDESQSQITMAGSVLGLPVKEQGPGSMTTSFFGTIVADTSAAAIQFTGGTELTARTNGVWRPGPGGASGEAPAAFAAQASTILGSVRGALRNVVLDLTSGVLPMTEGHFDASELLFAFPTNSVASFDYDAGFLGSDGIALSGISTNKIVNGATLTSTGDTRTLTIQVDTEFKFTALSDNDSVVHLTGKLVAVDVNLPMISAIEVKDQTVVLRVEGAGPEPRLESSPNLSQWTTENPARSTDAAGVVLTLPATAVHQFYRVAK